MKLERYAIVIFLVLTTFLLSGCFNKKKPPTKPAVESNDSVKQTEDETSGEWQSYKNSRYQFSVVYPPGWKLGEAPGNNDGREFTSPDGKISCYAYGFYNSLFNKEGKPQTLDEFVSWLNQDPNMKVIQEKKTKMAGYPAKEISSSQDGKVTQSIYILGSESGRGLYCTFDNLKELEKFKENFETMRKSFQINASLDG